MIVIVHVGVRRGDGCLGRSIGADRDVTVRIAGVRAIGIIDAMLLVIGIEVWTGGLEIGWLATGVLVDMNAMLARRKAVQVELDFDSHFDGFAGRRKHGRAD